MNRKSRWFEQRERGSMLGMRITIWLYRHLGRGVARVVLYPIVGYFFLTDRAGRRASISYLRRIYTLPGGEEVLGGVPGIQHVFRHFLEFGRSIFDRLAIWMGDRDDFNLEIHGEEHLRYVEREGRGAVILGAHLGSFDVMRVIADAQSPIAVHVLMFTRHAARINEIFRRLEDLSERANSVRVIEIRPGSFQHVLKARECVERGEVVAILADRVPPGETRRVSWVDFLGGPVPIPAGPFELAGILRVPVLFMVGLRRGKRSYEIHVERIADRLEFPRGNRAEAIDAHCQAYADRLASYCARAPYQWFNFFDLWSRESQRAA